MGTGVSRIGDQNRDGGKLLRGSKTVMVDNKPVALHVSPLTPHGNKRPPHNLTVTTSGSTTVMIDNCPVVKIGSSTSCGNPIIGGSSTVKVS